MEAGPTSLGVAVAAVVAVFASLLSSSAVRAGPLEFRLFISDGHHLESVRLDFSKGATSGSDDLSSQRFPPPWEPPTAAGKEGPSAPGGSSGSWPFAPRPQRPVYGPGQLGGGVAPAAAGFQNGGGDRLPFGPPPSFYRPATPPPPPLPPRLPPLPPPPPPPAAPLGNSTGTIFWQPDDAPLPPVLAAPAPAEGFAFSSLPSDEDGDTKNQEGYVARGRKG